MRVQAGKMMDKNRQQTDMDDNRQPTTENNGNSDNITDNRDPKIRYRGKLIAAAILFALALFIIIVSVLSHGYEFISIACFFIVAGATILLFRFAELRGERTPPRPVMPLVALFLYIVCLPLGVGMSFSTHGDTLFMLIMLLSGIIIPILLTAAVLSGIVTLCAFRKSLTAGDKGMCIAAIVLPIVTVATLVILISCRVIVIVLM